MTETEQISNETVDPAGAPSRHSPAAPQPPARANRFFVAVDRRLAWLDGWISRWLPAELNPLAQAGAAANLALVIAVASGVLMLVWYSPSVQFAYPSLVAIAGRTVGGTVRAIHRYSSDLAMLFLIVHAGRVFFARKFGGARWLPWVSGIAMLGLVWLIGWTGFWLVWDQPAQQVAVSSMRWVDSLPIFGEPMGRLYVADRTVPSLLFFVVFFLHMLLPLAIAVGLAVHLMRISRARLLPPRLVSLAILGALLVAALVAPAPLDAPARMAMKAPTFTVDAWYLSPLAFALRLRETGVWLALLGATALSMLIPWLLGRRDRGGRYRAEVDIARCHACTQCVQDCPFDAITMVPRTDGKRFESHAQVDPARCIGCGICAGGCDSEAIALPWFDTRSEETRIGDEAIAHVARGGSPWVAFVCAEIHGDPETTPAHPWSALLPNYFVQVVPTASWVRPKLVERLLAKGIRGVLVVRDTRAEAWSRDGRRWGLDRLRQQRKPHFRPERAAGGKWSVVDFDASRPSALLHAAERFQRAAERSETSRPNRTTVAIGGAMLALLVGVVTVSPSHLRVTNPASAEPEFVFAFKASGAMKAPPPLDPVAEAAKPVYMRGRVTEKPHRADVVVRLTIDGQMEERTFTAKGVSHDGPAIGEWRHNLTPGAHRVHIEVQDTIAPAAPIWEAEITGVARRLTVVTYDPAAGFRLE